MRRQIGNVDEDPESATKPTRWPLRPVRRLLRADMAA